MDRYNKGVIFTNDKCIGCNRCISSCSLLGANVSVVKNSVAHMEIDSRKCNDCGRCINVCVHNARDYRDDTEKFFSDLKHGEKISVVIAPTFFGIYGDKADSIIGCLKSLGVDKVYDGGYGREISAYLVAKHIKETRNLPVNERQFISNACPALVTVIQKYHPFLLEKIVPVQPASVCSAIYAHKYLGDTNKIAYLSACVASKDEVDSENTGGNLNYNITFSRVVEKLSAYNLDDYKGKGEIELSSGFGSLVAKGGDFADLISYFFPRIDNIISLKGFSESNMGSLYLSFDEEYSSNLPILAEITACPAGCIAGPGTDNKHFDFKKTYSNINKIQKTFYEKYKDIENPDKFWKQISSQFKYLRAEDFTRTYTDYSCQKFKVPKSTIDEIYSDMLKDTPQKQNINCRSCGYNSCQEMARAIAFGYSRKESCIHYMNDLSYRRLNTDEDTGLLSPLAFKREGAILFAKNPDKNYIVAIGDVNKLMIINDLYSFSTGTAVLKQIAATLRQIAGDDGLVSRLGGGSFALCMENTVDNLQRLQSCKIFDCSSLNISFPVTMHFGIRIANAQVGLGAAMNQATLCMKSNVSSVQNTFSAFTEKNLEHTYLEADITSKMQQALKNNEFKVWFQPQYSASTGEIVGAEALCRWIEADGKVISPAVFIPVAEKNGFIRILDEVIWESVFSSVRNWLDKGIEPVPVSLNISRINLETDRLFYTIKHLKEKYKIPERYIHFEITESASMKSQESLNQIIQKIRDLGFCIAMDDFGSGYSSLNSLKDMPIDILKLDMGFVRGKDNMNRGGTILNYVVRMAQGLEYITIAEGVETQEQADFLRSIGVNVFQGYLYAKPMPEDQFLSILKSSECHTVVNRPKNFGQIDVRKFLSPDSSESLIFEDYAGPSAIYEYDDKAQAMVLIRANKKYLALYELQDQPFREVRKYLRTFMNKKSYAELIESVKECILNHSESMRVIETRTYGKGVPLWLKLHFWEISVVDNKHSLFFFAEDVTGEKITENTLELTNNQLGLLMEKSQVGMCLLHFEVDLKNIFNSLKIRVLRVNQTFANMSGFSEQEVLLWTEKELFGVIHPLDRPGFIAKCFKAIVNKYKKPFSYTYSALTKDGYYKKIKIFVSGVRQPDKTYMLITNYIEVGNTKIDADPAIDDAGYSAELFEQYESKDDSNK